MREKYPSPLSKAHNRPFSPEMTYWRGGSLLISRRGVETQNITHGQRGKIVEFSKAARLRMMKFLGTIQRDQLPVFVTLTFPENFPSVAESKRVMKSFLRREKRAWPDLAGIIKIEPQLRGAAHFHLLVWNLVENKFYKYLLWVADNWHELAGQGDENHLKLLLGELEKSRPCVEKVRSWGGVMHYTSKYLAKTIEKFHGQYPGRFWWTFNREKIPWAEEVTVPVSREKAELAIRYMRRFSRVKSRNYSSLSVLCQADQWAKNLDLPLSEEKKSLISASGIADTDQTKSAINSKNPFVRASLEMPWRLEPRLGRVGDLLEVRRTKAESGERPTVEPHVGGVPRG